MTAAELAAAAAIVVGLLGLIGVPVSAQVTGRVQARSERLKRRAEHESEALGTLLRAWIVMDQLADAHTTERYQSAYCDWLMALAEIAAYSLPAASAAFAAFVRNGATASDPQGRALLVDAVFQIRRGGFQRRLGDADRASIATLLFGTVA